MFLNCLKVDILRKSILYDADMKSELEDNLITREMTYMRKMKTKLIIYLKAINASSNHTEY